MPVRTVMGVESCPTSVPAPQLEVRPGINCIELAAAPHIIVLNLSKIEQAGDLAWSNLLGCDEGSPHCNELWRLRCLPLDFRLSLMLPGPVLLRMA